MRHRLLFVIGALVAVVVASLTPVLFARQTATTEGATPSRTSWGDPDLQGVWMATTPTPPRAPRRRWNRGFDRGRSGRAGAGTCTSLG